MKLEDLLWWQNYQHIAQQRMSATTDAHERAALQVVARVTSDVIVRIGRKLAAESKATLARLDAEDAAEVLS